MPMNEYGEIVRNSASEEASTHGSSRRTRGNEDGLGERGGSGHISATAKETIRILFMIFSLAGMVFSLVASLNDLIMFLKFIPYIPALTLDVIVLVCVFMIGCSKNDFESFVVSFVCVVWYVVLYGIIVTSVYYTEVGWNAAGVTSAWKHFGNLLVCSLVAFLIGKLIGKWLLNIPDRNTP